VANDFRQTPEYSAQQMIRRVIRQAKTLTRAERDVTLVVVNAWFWHRALDGQIHPGRKRIARKAGCCVRTVASVLDRLRNAGVLMPIQYLKGGNRSTRYRVCTLAIFDFCGVSIPETLGGDLEALETVQFCTAGKSKIARLTSAKIAHGTTAFDTSPSIPGQEINQSRDMASKPGNGLSLDRLKDPSQEKILERIFPDSGAIH
jgi:hypothetical protein